MVALCCRLSGGDLCSVRLSFISFLLFIRRAHINERMKLASLGQLVQFRLLSFGKMVFKTIKR